MIFIKVIGGIVLSTTVNFSSPSLPGDSPAVNEVSWNLVDADDKIAVYERWVSLPDGRKTRERKGVFSVEAEASSVLPLVSSAEGIKHWMRGVEESKELDATSGGSKYIYLYFDAPWPFKNRDLVTSITTIQACGSPCIDVYFSAINNYFPEKENVERLQSYEAHWQILETSPGKTKITFAALSDTPLVVPKWIQDPVTEKLFKDNLLNLMELLTLNEQ